MAIPVREWPQTTAEKVARRHLMILAGELQQRFGYKGSDLETVLEDAIRAVLSGEPVTPVALFSTVGTEFTLDSVGDALNFVCGAPIGFPEQEDEDSEDEQPDTMTVEPNGEDIRLVPRWH